MACRRWAASPSSICYPRLEESTISKGAVSGVAIGSAITAALSVFPTSKVRPKDAASNLSYMFAHLAYGVVTATVASLAGDPTVFDAEPVNDYILSDDLTSEERRVRRELDEGLCPPN